MTRTKELNGERAVAFQRALEAAVPGEVRFDAGSKAVYSADASNYRQIPICVVTPRNANDIEQALAVCRAFDVPVLPRGGGTSMNGQSVNVAAVFDLSRHMRRVLQVDPVARVADVEPGVVCDALRDAAELHGLTFGPDPATHSRCTLGGMIGNNSCGAHSVMAGKTVENIESLEILTYDGARFRVGPTTEEELAAIIAEGGRRGEIYAALRSLRDRYADAIRRGFPRINRRVSGYNLDQLLPENGFNVARALVGSEGGCAITLEARTRLVPSPKERVVLVLGFPDIYLAGDAVPRILPYKPIATEGLDIAIIGGLKRRGLRLEEIGRLPQGDAWIMVEFGADSAEAARAQAQALVDEWGGEADGPSHWLIEDPAWTERIWTIREVGASATSLQDQPGLPDPVVGWEDAAVDPLRLGDYLREFQQLIDRYGYQTSLFGHFGDGCIHARITFDLRTAEGIATWRAFLREAAELVVRYGGSLTGEHGDGQAKAEFLPIMYGPELMQAFTDFKAIWDPLHRMNPHKLIEPYRVDQHLRQGPDYRPIRFDTRLAFRGKGGGSGFDDFSRAVERCIGMGKCRSEQGGLMCPSYRATGEEKHSTRGRARLLFEMLRGELVNDGWRSEAVREGLELCLGCKGCKSDCPTHVDMASFKAEFLSHYHEHHARPVQAWSMGRIGQWAPLAARLPRLANLLTQRQPFAWLAKRLAGIDQSRQLPRIAPKPFAPKPGKEDPERPRVILWVDTFSRYFEPSIAHSAQAVLEHAGYQVILPSVKMCCGRPLYDFGLLDVARSQLQQVLQALSEEVRQGTPVIGLEPSCASVFRDELLKLFPDDPDAKRLADATWLLPDFLRHVGYQPRDPADGRNVLLHGHCHQKAVFSGGAEAALLGVAGYACNAPESGCCGMAGGFGFRPETIAVARAIGEQKLLPAVRAAGEDTLIVASGFSCREQIRQSTGRPVLHVAEVLASHLPDAQNTIPRPE